MTNLHMQKMTSNRFLKTPEHFIVGRSDGELVAISSEPHVLHEIHRKARVVAGEGPDKKDWSVTPIEDCWEKGRLGFKTVVTMEELAAVLQNFALSE